MKLVRYGPAGEEKPGIVDQDGRIRDASAYVPDFQGDALHPQRLQALRVLDRASLPLVDGAPRLGPPVAGVGKILGIGLNYRSHAEETGATPGAEPLVFSKAVSALSGPNDPIVIPFGSKKTDWEVEVAVIIGVRAHRVEVQNALDYVAGYAVINDVSERSFQKERGGQFVKGKSADSFAPLGPWLVTPDEVPDPQNLDLWLDRNGQRQQTGHSSDMIFSVAEIISHLSQFMSLLPGDVIATGTPSGVGAGCKPPVFLQPGDTLRLGVSRLGEQTQTAIAYEPPR